MHRNVYLLRLMTMIAWFPGCSGDGHKVAMCLVGQFLRDQHLEVSIRKRFSAGFGASSTYHAFVATSTQQFEDNIMSVTNTTTICENLKARGFHSCTPEAIPYDGQEFMTASSSLDFRLPNGLYPHRVSVRCFCLVDKI